MITSRAVLVGAVMASLVATCNEAPPQDPALAHGQAVGLLAIDLAPSAGDLRAAELLPTAIAIEIDGELAGEVQLPAPTGLLSGHATLPLLAGDRHELVLRARFADGTEAATEAVEVEVGADEVLVVPLDGVLEVADGALAGRSLVLGAHRTLALPADTDLAVTFRDAARAPVVLSEMPPRPAAAIAAVLRDTQIDSVAPFTEVVSQADEVGALVAVQRPVVEVSTEPAVSVEPAARRAAEAEVRPVASPVVVVPEPEPVLTPAPTRPDDFIYYYAYCTCGKPVADRPYTVETASGITLAGQTDRYGFVLHVGVGAATIDFGPRQRTRERAYAFAAADPDAHLPELLASLGSEIRNDQLVAMSDLRRAPLEGARGLLSELLDHPEEFVRTNAAVTLSHYDGLDGLVDARLALLGRAVARGDAAQTVYELAVLGALRHPALVPFAAELAQGSDDPSVRGVALWALGFVADSGPAARAALGAAANGDEYEENRAEARAALGRLPLTH